jgi:peptidoglycan LD-endopeptidase CwlK
MLLGNSEHVLLTANPFLQQLFREVAKAWDLTVLEGVRTLERQKELVASGSSKTLASRHLAQADGFSAAVDVAPRGLDATVTWQDSALFYYFGGYVMRVAQDLGLHIRWGGDWDGDHQVKDQNFNDLVHFEIPA